MNQSSDPAVTQTCEEIRSAITSVISDAEISVSGNGDHYDISVSSSSFEGKSSLQRQRLVYKSISHLMAGANPPVHAVDRLETSVPEAAHQVIAVTQEAQAQVAFLIEQEGRPGIGLRLAIKGGGCSGLSYDMDFSEQREGDTVVVFDNFSVFLDRKSVIYLSGVALAYEGGLAGRGFVFQNPQATNTCGCGESFSL